MALLLWQRRVLFGTDEFQPKGRVVNVGRSECHPRCVATTTIVVVVVVPMMGRRQRHPPVMDRFDRLLHAVQELCIPLFFFFVTVGDVAVGITVGIVTATVAAADAAAVAPQRRRPSVVDDTVNLLLDLFPLLDGHLIQRVRDEGLDVIIVIIVVSLIILCVSSMSAGLQHCRP